MAHKLLGIGFLFCRRLASISSATVIVNSLSFVSVVTRGSSTISNAHLFTTLSQHTMSGSLAYSYAIVSRVRAYYQLVN